jgi:hypothetical protein
MAIKQELFVTDAKHVNFKKSTLFDSNAAWRSEGLFRWNTARIVIIRNHITWFCDLTTNR